MMSSDLASKLRHARALRATREAQIQAYQSDVYEWMEACASMHHSVNYNGKRFVEYVRSYPFDTVQHRIRATLESWLAAAKQAASKAPPSRGNRRESRVIVEDCDESDVVTVTKIQFLEQQLAELRAMMATQAGNGLLTPSPSVPVPASRPAPSSAASQMLEALSRIEMSTARSSASAQSETPVASVASTPLSPPRAHASATAPSESSACMKSPTPMMSPNGRPNMVALVQQASSSVKLKPAAETPAKSEFVQSELKSPAGLMSPPNGRPNMVALVQHAASSVKLKSAASTPAPSRKSVAPEIKTSASTGLEAMLKTAFQNKFASLRAAESSDDSDDESEVLSPMGARTIKRVSLSKSLAVGTSGPRRRSLRRNDSATPTTPQVEGFTTASLQAQQQSVVSTPVESKVEAKDLSQSAPPRPAGGMSALLADIQHFKKGQLKNADESVPVPTPTKAPVTQKPAVTPVPPAPKRAGGSLMDQMKSVSLRKTGIVREGQLSDKEN